MSDKRKETIDTIFDSIFSRAGFSHGEMRECLGRAYDAGEQRGIEAARKAEGDAEYDTCHELADGCDGCTSQKCYRCGLHVCTNENCSTIVPYYHYGNQRLCHGCNLEYTEDIKRALGPTPDALTEAPEGGK